MIEHYQQTKSLMDAVDRYIYFGYSLIPVRDDKSPIFSWKSNQTQRDSINFLQTLIRKRKDVAGIGIVTGTISRLAVLDFDDLNLFYAFQKQHPNLTKTYTVRTRRGYHLYYQVDEKLKTQTRKCTGVDWLYNGAYVVAPPSVISGFVYQIEKPDLTYQLTSTDLNQIHQFLETHRPIKSNVLSPEGESPSGKLLPEDVLRLYKQYASQGRNNALFRVALLARDYGWSQSTVSHVLLESFVQDCTEDEDRQNRYKEGLRTIASAFSRPARIRLVEGEPEGLPNTVREALLARGLACAIRTLDSLRQKGIHPGQFFTEANARELLDGIVGHHSIRKTLSADICRKRITYVAKKIPKGTISKCLEISQTKSKLNPKGRKTHIYIMPSNLELAEHLNVKLTRISDPLSNKDLSSAKKVRQAMHRELLVRRPGVYPSRWLAQRLSVSVVTKNRYDRAIPVHKMPTYKTYPITFQSCGIIPEDDANGIFLEDDTGKRYPPKIDIAKYLLKRGRGITLKVQTHNFYYVGNPLAKLNTSPLPSPAHRMRFESPIYTSRMVEAFPQNHPKQPKFEDSGKKMTQPTQLTLFQEKSRDNTKSQKSYQKSYTVPLPHPTEEDAAQRLYKSIGQVSFSLVSARRLVDRYGVAAVQYAAKRLKDKKKADNPAGLVTVIARSYRFLE